MSIEVNRMISEVLKVYKTSDVLTAANIVKSLMANGVEVDDLLAHEEYVTEKSKADAEATAKSSIRTRRKLRREARKRKGGGGKNQKAPFLKPGDSEPLSGVKCEKCDGSMIYEALCGKTAQKKGCIRIGLCIECGSEIKIK